LIQISNQLEIEHAQKDPLRSGLCGDRAHLGQRSLRRGSDGAGFDGAGAGVNDDDPFLLKGLSGSLFAAGARKLTPKYSQAEFNVD
jgi:hypothetical protein